MKKFIFAVHNHQPVGNFDHVIREAFEKSYKPFIDLVFNTGYPKICFHFSGILYEWIEKNYPHYIDMISEMVKRSQVEILSGGYYEPILSVIPENDAVEQIKRMNDFIFKRFGCVPEGIWLTERVYNPCVINRVAKCGIKYLIVDDTHILNSGLNESEIKNVLIAENCGDSVNVFAIDHKLRYLIPYRPVNEVIEYINRTEGNVFVMADDGEKFGLWPQSYKLVYEERWLYNFFESVKNSDIEMRTFSEVLKEHNSRKRLIYIPTTSYFEMTEWAIDCESSIKLDDFKKSVDSKYMRFVKGGIFENFFTKYQQSNLIHKRVFDVSRKLEKNYNIEAADYLYRAECNCGWWHGVFGGIYLPHIRHAIYQNLLECQKRIYKRKNRIEVSICDFDFDGKQEIVVESDNNFFIFSPAYGGSIVEFSSKNKCVNYSSVMSRFREAYHIKEIRDINGNLINKINEDIHYDWHERRTLLDHFITENTTLDMFSRASYPEQGDFIPQEYSHSVFDYGTHVEIKMTRTGTAWYNEFPYRVWVEKIVKISDFDGYDVEYCIRNLSDRGGRFVFVSELIFGFSSQNTAPLRDVDGINEYIFYDSVRGNIKINFSRPLRLWIFPIFTISNSESGTEKTYQGSCAGCVLNEYFEPYETKKFSFSLRVF